MEKHCSFFAKIGEDEYDAMEMLRYGVVIERLEDREELTEEYLAELDRKHEPDRVVIEYNGMWKVSDFENMKLPKGWGSSRRSQQWTQAHFRHI